MLANFRTFYYHHSQLSVGKGNSILMSLVPISKAAKLVGKHPTTLKAAIKKGKLSASKNDNDEWQIDVSEVTRIYPIKDKNNESEGDNKIITLNDKSSTVRREELEILRQENAVLKERLASKEREIELIICQLEQSEKRERQLYDLASQNGKLLAHYTEQEKQLEKQPKRKGWFFR